MRKSTSLLSLGILTIYEKINMINYRFWLTKVRPSHTTPSIITKSPVEPVQLWKLQRCVSDSLHATVWHFEDCREGGRRRFTGDFIVPLAWCGLLQVGCTWFFLGQRNLLGAQDPCIWRGGRCIVTTKIGRDVDCQKIVDHKLSTKTTPRLKDTLSISCDMVFLFLNKHIVLLREHYNSITVSSQQ